MNKLSAKQYEQIGKEFFEFYMENGFAHKSKSDIDCFIYNKLCEMNYINDLNESALIIGKKLNASTTTITKYNEWRCYQGKTKEDKLKNSLKEHLKICTENKSIFVRSDKITFSVHIYALKYFLESFLQKNNYTYDYSFSGNNISLTPKAFLMLLEKLDCDFKKSINEFLSDEDVNQTLNEPDNIIIKNLIINIQNSNKESKDKWLDIATEIIKSTVSVLVTALIQKTL